MNPYFLPIPSADYRYEIDQLGNVRNVKTGKALKRCGGNGRGYFVHLSLGNSVRVVRTINSLLWEVHGILRGKGISFPVSVTISKDGTPHTFKSLNACAKFIAEREHYSVHTPRRDLSVRKSCVCGWNVIYNEPEQRRMLTGAEANRDYELRRHLRK